LRAAELSSGTGVPTPFVVAFEQFFDDCHAAERSIHAELDRRGWRLSSQREFFRGPASDIIRLILDTSPPTIPSHRAVAPASPDTLLAAGENALHGLGDTLQDTSEAVRCFRRAAALGSLMALERLGGIYSDVFASRMNAANRRRAMTPLKEGARRGNAYCYCEMSKVFAAEGHIDNFHKAWALFFSKSAASAPDDVARFANACAIYIGMCLDLRQQPDHLADLHRMARPILMALMTDMERYRAQPVRRQRASDALRWTYALMATDGVKPERAHPLRSRWRLLVAAVRPAPQTSLA
jgi:TPR repeat protein